jgi:hypothetical protein
MPFKHFFLQNFGNPYDCPEGMYGGSMMSSVGYSQVHNGTLASSLVSMYIGSTLVTKQKHIKYLNSYGLVFTEKNIEEILLSNNCG